MVRANAGHWLTITRDNDLQTCTLSTLDSYFGSYCANQQKFRFKLKAIMVIGGITQNHEFHVMYKNNATSPVVY